MVASKTLAQRANLNMEASKVLTGKAHESTRKLESITSEMHQIAQKTKQETVSMRTITLVTLFFLPGTKTEAYFKDIGPVKKLLAVLFPNGAPKLDPEIIRKKYVKVFLILLLTGNGHFIELFVRHDSLCDQYLPFRSRPTHFPNSAGDADFFTSFYRKQWEFCARIFRNETHQQFDEKDLILPIISREKLGSGGSATVLKIELHPAYNKLFK